jgi:hypothetical protein
VYCDIQQAVSLPYFRNPGKLFTSSGTRPNYVLTVSALSHDNEHKGASGKARLSKDRPAALNQHRRTRHGKLALCSRLAILRHCSHHQQGTGKEDPNTGKISNSIENQNEDSLLQVLQGGPSAGPLGVK